MEQQQQPPFFQPSNGSMKRPYPQQFNNYRGNFNGFRGRGSRGYAQQRGGNRGRGTRNFHDPAFSRENLGPADYFMPSFLQDPWKDILTGGGVSGVSDDCADASIFVMQSFFEDPWCVLLASSPSKSATNEE